MEKRKIEIELSEYHYRLLDWDSSIRKKTVQEFAEDCLIKTLEADLESGAIEGILWMHPRESV